MPRQTIIVLHAVISFPDMNIKLCTLLLLLSIINCVICYLLLMLNCLLSIVYSLLPIVRYVLSVFLYHLSLTIHSYVLFVYYGLRSMMPFIPLAHQQPQQATTHNSKHQIGINTLVPQAPHTYLAPPLGVQWPAFIVSLISFLFLNYLVIISSLFPLHFILTSVLFLSYLFFISYFFILPFFLFSSYLFLISFLFLANFFLIYYFFLIVSYLFLVVAF